MSKTLLVMAGGTGGHVSPGLPWPIASRHRAGLFTGSVPPTGWRPSWCPPMATPSPSSTSRGVRGNGIKRLLAAPYRIVKSVLQARQVLKTIQPDVVLGMGGFASGPGGVAAWLCRHSAAAARAERGGRHDQQAAGTSGQAGADGLPWRLRPNARTAVVGNPVRPEVVALPDPRCVAAASRCGC